MKKTLLQFATLLLLGTSLLVSCKKDASTSATTNSSTSAGYYFKCKIQGTDWAASNPVAHDTMFLGTRAYLIQDKSLYPGNQLLLGILPFSLTTWSMQQCTYVNPTFSLYTNFSGMSNMQLTVANDSVNRVLTGSFSFPLLNKSDNTDTIKVTNGSFKVKY